MKSLSHANGEPLSSYAYTTLEEVSNRLKTRFLPFEEARNYARSLGLTNEREWRILEIPPNVPRNPDQAYSNHWVSWGDWLGNDNASNWNRCYLPFEEARACVQSIGLKTHEGW
jgi:hypothetical protein